MIRISALQRPKLIFLAASVAYGLLIWMLLPDIVVALDDDFSYLRSAIETYRHGRPLTDDWLNPWAASSSVVVALLYAVTGSFWFAVHGFLAGAAAIGFGFMARHLHAHGFPLGSSILVTALVWATPTVMFMSLMFTSVALYMACLWGCVYFYQQQRWAGFFLMWAVAIAGRQSAVVWLLLPGLSLLREQWQARSLLPRNRSSWELAAWLAGAICFFLVLKLGMNPTRGQDIVLRTIRQSFGWQTASVPMGLGVLALLAGHGLAGLASIAGKGGALPWGWRRGLILICLAGAGMVAVQWFHQHILWTHWCYERKGVDAYLILMGGLAGAGLALRPMQPRWEFIATAMATLFLLCLYGGTYDYYFTDLFFWGLAGGLASSCVPLPLPDQAWIPRITRGAVFALLLIAGGMELRSAGRQKLQQDHAVAQILLYENAIRSGRLAPHQIGQAPFGYAGWYWENYFARHEGLASLDLAGFLFYTDRWDGERGTGVVSDYPRALRSSAWLRAWLPGRNNKELVTSQEAVTLGEVASPVLWFFPAKFVLKRGGGDSKPANMFPIQSRDYKSVRYPLNDAEWTCFIKGMAF